MGGRTAGNKDRRRLVKRALREHWAIAPKVRASVIERLGKIVQDSEARPRDVAVAGRAILAAGKINLDDMSVAIKPRTHEGIARRQEVVEHCVNERAGV